MGTYTEIIFGARLKKSTPKNIIDTLRFVANGPKQDINEEDPVIVYDKELIIKYNLIEKIFEEVKICQKIT